jgi:Holliday junction resolvasome RuvABC endonuclease subunit
MMLNSTLSFDVSSVSTGWAVISEKSEIVSSGKIVPMSTDIDMTEKLFYLRQMVICLLHLYEYPKTILIEETYMKNVTTLKVLSQLIGVVRETCYEFANTKPIFISPNSVRSFFKVKGKEEAYEYVVKRFKKQFKHSTFEDDNDITDSILQGLYFLEKEKSNE